MPCEYAGLAGGFEALGVDSGMGWVWKASVGSLTARLIELEFVVERFEGFG